MNIDISLDRLDVAMQLVENKQPTDFWIQCVRDASGRWLKYEGHSSRYGVKYFRGYQPMVDYANADEVTYLVQSIETRRMFYKGLESTKFMDVPSFIELLERLRTTLQYRPVDEWLHQRFATSAHTIIVQEEIMTIAKKYQDPYATGESTGPTFTNFPKQSLPYDKHEDELIVHHYPNLEWTEYYLGAALSKLKELCTGDLTREEYIYRTANFYQLLINLHYFAAMNASLYMNMANGLLEAGGIKGIENGIIDFVALRLQPTAFQEYFLTEVKR